MFRYGLVGNTIIFGGGFSLLGYTAYELYKLSESSTKMNEDLARELFEEKNILQRRQEESKTPSAAFSGKRIVRKMNAPKKEQSGQTGEKSEYI